LGVTEGVASKGKEGGERAWQIDALRLFHHPRSQQHTTRRKLSPRSYVSRGKDSQQIPFPPFGRLGEEKEREGGGFGVLGFAYPELKIWKYEFICKRLLKPTNSFQGFFDTSKKL
jgi:hypothetical protein